MIFQHIPDLQVFYTDQLVLYADYLINRCGKIICLNKKGTFEFINVIDLCETYWDNVTAERRDKEYRGYTTLGSDSERIRSMDISEIAGACKLMKGIVAVQINHFFNVGMVALDKDCKVYYLGYFGDD